MSRPTSAFAGYIDYQEAFLNKDKDPILFGVRSAKPPFSVPLNRQITGQETLNKYLKRPKQYHGRIFHPEKRKLPDGSYEEWSADKNRAFWAGAIDAKRTFLLITDINHYAMFNLNSDEWFLRGTVIEILWLIDNGYQVKPNPENPLQTLFIPPSDRPVGKMQPYFKLNERKNYPIETIRRIEKNLNLVQTTVTKKRKLLEQKQQAPRKRIGLR